MSGIALFTNTQVLFAQQGRIEASFVTYQKCIKKILRGESSTAPLHSAQAHQTTFPVRSSPAWSCFQTCFRHTNMSFTSESHPEAYKLLDSFLPGASSKLHVCLERTTQGKIPLKGMQIVSGHTLGLLAWDRRDRATAAKRFKLALDLDASCVLMTLEPGAVGMERYIHQEVGDMKDNLDMLVHIDTENDLIAAAMNPTGYLPQCRDVIELPLPRARQDKTGQIDLDTSMVIATHASGKCGKRDVKLMWCSLCQKVYYCSPECQKADWRVHKHTTCLKKTGST